MKNMKKKGFTLVELLVVIAILAILAAVSVVGYTAFIARANQSNAVTELSQIKDVVMAAVLDGEETVDDVKFTYASNDLSATVDDENATEDEIKDAIKTAILTLAEMTLSEGQNLEVTLTGDVITSVTYTYVEGTSATWNVTNGTVQ